MVRAPGVSTGSGASQALREAVHGLRGGAGDLHVGGIAGAGERHVVLARGAGRHVLVGAEAAHHPHVGLHAVPLEAGAVEDPVVGAGVEVVGGREALLVAVEAVGVLHDELARAQYARARARLVALLDLEVIEQLGQVPVGAHLPGHVVGERLLVGHREHHVGAAAVLELEQLLDRIAAGALPQLGGLEHRHEHLQAPHGVHLLPHDLLRSAMHAPAGRHPGPHAGTQLAHQPGAHHQLVRHRLGVRGRLLLGG